MWFTMVCTEQARTHEEWPDMFNDVLDRLPTTQTVAAEGLPERTIDGALSPGPTRTSCKRGHKRSTSPGVLTVAKR